MRLAVLNTRLGRGADHLRPPSAEVKDRVIPLLPLFALMVCNRVEFTFSFYTLQHPTVLLVFKYYRGAH